MSAEYAFDLYPRDDPKDGTRLVRYTYEDLVAAEYRDVIGVGSGQAVIWVDHSGAEHIDVRGEQYIRVVRLVGTEAVVGGIWTSKLPFETAVASERRHLTISGPGQMAYLARAVMAPHAYLNIAGFGDMDPFDGMWRLYAAGTGGELGAMLWRVITEAQGFRVGVTPYTHRHGDGLTYTDIHDDDRLVNRLSELTMSFDQNVDSDGNAWTLGAGEFTAQVGENVLGVTQRLMQAGLFVWMDPDTFVLHAWEGRPSTKLGRATDRTGASWGADIVRFQSPTDATTATGNILSDANRIVNSYLPRGPLWVGGNDIYHKEDGPADALYEGFVRIDTNDLASLGAIGEAQSTAREEAADVGQLHVKLGDGEADGYYLPGEHYLLDDLVTVNTGAGEFDYDEAAYPIGAWRVSLPENSAEWESWPELGASYDEAQRREFAVPSTPGHTHPPSPAICRDTFDDISTIETFTRTEASGWGTSEIGPWEWTRSGGSASVDGDEGITAGGSLELQADGTWALPIEILIKARFTDLFLESLDVLVYEDAVGTPIEWMVENDGIGNTEVTGDVGGTALFFNVDSGLDIAVGTPFWTRMIVTATDISVAVWEDGDPEPAAQGSDSGTNTYAVSRIDRLLVRGGSFAIDSIEIITGLTGPRDTCIHGGDGSNSGDASESCSKCVAPGNHEHVYVAAGGTTGQVLKKASAADWDTTWGTDNSGAPTTANYLTGSAQAGLSAEIVVGTTPGGELGGTWASPTVDATHSGSTHASRAPATADFLVGTADAGLSAEIVVGTTPGGELGGTWASPTVDATHSGSSHAGVITAHEALADPHTGYVREADANWVDLTDGGATTLHTHAGAAHTHVNSEVPAGTVDGANDTFTLAATPAAGTLHLYKNGLRQKAGAGNDYTLATATITFLAGNIPLTGDTLLADYVT